MARRRFHCSTLDEEGAWLHGDAAAHAAVVLRAAVGQQYEVACNGRVYLGTITTISPVAVCFALAAELSVEPETDSLTLAAAIIKFDRFEWLVEKATELGVGCILPLVSRRTASHLAQAAGKRVERWRRVVHQAAEQSRRSTVPTVQAPQTLAVFLESRSAASPTFWLAESGPAQALLLALNDRKGSGPFTVVVGPEGGWTEEESTAAGSAGLYHVTLGDGILRAETAALAALAVVQAWRALGANAGRT